MKIHKYENLYPRAFWIAILGDEPVDTLLKRFVFFKNKSGWMEWNSDAAEELEGARDNAIAACYPVQDRRDGSYGVLLVIVSEDSMDTDITAHEAVHIADYFFEATGCSTEEFTGGNEAYAYLVGWAAGCIANVLIKNKKK